MYFSPLIYLILFHENINFQNGGKLCTNFVNFYYSPGLGKLVLLKNNNHVSRENITVLVLLHTVTIHDDMFASANSI